MSLLDKQEVQDICGHTALRASVAMYHEIIYTLLSVKILMVVCCHVYILLLFIW